MSFLCICLQLCFIDTFKALESVGLPKALSLVTRLLDRGLSTGELVKVRLVSCSTFASSGQTDLKQTSTGAIIAIVFGVVVAMMLCGLLAWKLFPSEVSFT